MTTILSLDTSTKVCSIALHEDGVVIGTQSYHLQKSHSNLLPCIINELLTNCELRISDLDAVAISAGPGSYTGLRIGTATVKGLAYSLDLPLIAINTLDTMIEQVRPILAGNQALLCPMIDARRMEVYCKLISTSNKEIWPTKPVIVDEDTFSGFDEPIYVFGNGSDKLRSIFNDPQIRFIEGIDPKAAFMGLMAFEQYQAQNFVDLAYFEPDYLKEYRTNTPSKKFSL